MDFHQELALALCTASFGVFTGLAPRPRRQLSYTWALLPLILIGVLGASCAGCRWEPALPTSHPDHGGQYYFPETREEVREQVMGFLRGGLSAAIPCAIVIAYRRRKLRTMHVDHEDAQLPEVAESARPKLLTAKETICLVGCLAAGLAATLWLRWGKHAPQFDSYHAKQFMFAVGFMLHTAFSVLVRSACISLRNRGAKRGEVNSLWHRVYRRVIPFLWIPICFFGANALFSLGLAMEWWSVAGNVE